MCEIIFDGAMVPLCLRIIFQIFFIQLLSGLKWNEFSFDIHRYTSILLFLLCQINQHSYIVWHDLGECESWFVGIWPTWILMNSHSRPTFFLHTLNFHFECFSSPWFLLIFTTFLYFLLLTLMLFICWTI